MELAGKVALITGGRSGVGEAAALRLAREGCVAGVQSQTEEEVASATDEIREAGGGLMPLAGRLGATAGHIRVSDPRSKPGRLYAVIGGSGRARLKDRQRKAKRLIG